MVSSLRTDSALDTADGRSCALGWDHAAPAPADHRNVTLITASSLLRNKAGVCVLEVCPYADADAGKSTRRDAEQVTFARLLHLLRMLLYCQLDSLPRDIDVSAITLIVVESRNNLRADPGRT